jgi:hypothetical protein
LSQLIFNDQSIRFPILLTPNFLVERRNFFSEIGAAEINRLKIIEKKRQEYKEFFEKAVKSFLNLKVPNYLLSTVPNRSALSWIFFNISPENNFKHCYSSFRG